MISWGLVTCSMMFVRGPWGFCLLRILLGVAEAGFFPGIILYLTYWFPARERAGMVALFMAASPLTGVLGNPLSGAIMERMDDVAGLAGWQWVFLLEGIPAVLLGVAVLFYLTDRPQMAGWLTADERDWLTGQVGRADDHHIHRSVRSLLPLLTDGRVGLLILLYFAIATGSNGFGFYLPTLLAEQFPNFNKEEIGWLGAVPNICAMGYMIANGAHSDRTGERRWHVALPAFLSAGGWALAALTFLPRFHSPALTLVALCLIQSGIMSMIPTFWSLPTAFLRGVAAAGGIALINSVGNLGGFAGPMLLGQLKGGTGSFAPGLLAMAGILCAGGLLALCVRHDSAAEGEAPASRPDPEPGIIPAPTNAIMPPLHDRTSP